MLNIISCNHGLFVWLVYAVLQALKHNGSLYAHVYFARSGYPVDPTDPEYEQKSAFGRTHCTCSVFHCMFFLYMIIYIYMEYWLHCTCHLAVVAFLPKSKAGKKKSLLGDSEQPEEQAPPKVIIFILCRWVYGISYIWWANESLGLQENKEPHDKDEGPAEYISYWKPNITINLVDDFTRYSQNPICLSVLFVPHIGFYMFIKIYASFNFSVLPFRWHESYEYCTLPC